MLLSIMTISERSARQRCPANAKHGARLKAMKSMKFPFCTTINTESRSFVK